MKQDAVQIVLLSGNKNRNKTDTQKIDLTGTLTNILKSDKESQLTDG